MYWDCSRETWSHRSEQLTIYYLASSLGVRIPVVSKCASKQLELRSLTLSCFLLFKCFVLRNHGPTKLTWPVLQATLQATSLSFFHVQSSIDMSLIIWELSLSVGQRNVPKTRENELITLWIKKRGRDSRQTAYFAFSNRKCTLLIPGLWTTVPIRTVWLKISIPQVKEERVQYGYAHSTDRDSLKVPFKIRRLPHCWQRWRPSISFFKSPREPRSKSMFKREAPSFAGVGFNLTKLLNSN